MGSETHLEGIDGDRILNSLEDQPGGYCALSIPGAAANRGQTLNPQMTCAPCPGPAKGILRRWLAGYDE